MTTASATANEAAQLLPTNISQGPAPAAITNNNDDNHESFPSLRTLFFTPRSTPVVLTNSGSTARDHLANERTYLAWTRTGLSLIGVSLGLLKWTTVSSVAAYLIAVLGLAVLITATQRYFRVMQLLEQGQFEPNVHGILIVVTISVVAIIAAFILHNTEQLRRLRHTA